MPLPNEHACVLTPVDRYTQFRRGSRQHDGKTYAVLYGKLKDGSSWEEHSFRYPKGSWTATEARSHCAGHSGTFEAATGKDEVPTEVRSIADVKVEDVERADADLIVIDLEALRAEGADEIRMDPDDLKALFAECVGHAAQEVVAARFRQLTGRLD